MFIKIGLIFCSLLIVAFSFPQEVENLSRSIDIQPNGNFKWSYTNSDGSSQLQEGSAKPTGEGDDVEELVSGSYDFIDTNGNPHHVEYTAGEDGYLVNSLDVPVAKAREDHPAHVRAHEYRLAHPDPEEE
ncbi:hypothetical protein ABEB36_002930 [Hypothenemus hampei]|uniref:Uncharacterized protein n=1 Tax=Hypothenemus hampei TaxID=57062 RepID=A0ABD1F9B4_HYPHA